MCIFEPKSSSAARPSPAAKVRMFHLCGRRRLAGVLRSTSGALGQLPLFSAGEGRLPVTACISHRIRMFHFVLTNWFKIDTASALYGRCRKKRCSCAYFTRNRQISCRQLQQCHVLVYFSKRTTMWRRCGSKTASGTPRKCFKSRPIMSTAFASTDSWKSTIAQRMLCGCPTFSQFRMASTAESCF